MDSPEAPPRAATAKAENNKVADALALFPGIGPYCAWIYKHWGLTGLVSFIIGLILGLGLVFFGAVPKSFVSARYDSKQSGPKVMPSSIEVSPVRAPLPDWLQPYFDAWDQAAEGERVGTKRAGAGVVMSEPLGPTKQFRWFLRAAPGFDLTGKAFRYRKDGYLKVLEPVKSDNSVFFEVPEGEEGDRLAVVILATWQGDQPHVEIRDTFHSTVIASER